MFKTFLNFNFRWFVLAKIISTFGVGVSTVGANWCLIDRTNCSHLLGIMVDLNVLAGFLASPIIVGFVIILIVSLIIISLLIFINRSKEILYNDTGDMRGDHIE
ncbi:hypothetical protein [Staphylococcus casei]|uniref:Uncharacterized protein n=1 Tax=Staphylococcus casei TaxID=201828 RepID=A0ABZ2WES3_9STAP